MSDPEATADLDLAVVLFRGEESAAKALYHATPTETEPEPKVLADQLRTAVPRSRSALVMIGAPASVDELIAAVAESGGEVTRQTLTPDQIAMLNASLDADGAVPLLPRTAAATWPASS